MHYKTAIEFAYSQYNYDEYFPILPRMEEEARKWREWKEVLNKNGIDKATLDPVYRRALDAYIEFEAAYTLVTKTSEIFQKTMDHCYPGGAPPALKRETLEAIQLLEVDLEPIKRKFDEILTANLEQMKEKNRKMKFLCGEMKKILDPLVENLEPAAKLCGDRSGMKNPLTPSYFKQDVAARKVKK